MPSFYVITSLSLPLPSPTPGDSTHRAFRPLALSCGAIHDDRPRLCLYDVRWERRTEIEPFAAHVLHLAYPVSFHFVASGLYDMHSPLYDHVTYARYAPDPERLVSARAPPCAPASVRYFLYTMPPSLPSPLVS